MPPASEPPLSEAISQLGRGVERVASLPESRERAQQELLLQLALGRAFVVTQGWAAPEVEQAFVRARDLCRQVGEPTQLFRAVEGLFGIHLLRAEHDKTDALAEELLRLARETRAPAYLSVAHQTMGAAWFWRGEFCRAQEHLEEVISLYEPQEQRAYAVLYSSMDPAVSALVYLAWTLQNLGYPDQALTKSRDALALAQDLSHPFSQAFALNCAGRVHALRGEQEAALERGEALMALSSEHGFVYWLAVGAFTRGMSLAQQGQLEEGIVEIRGYLQARRAAATAMGTPWILLPSAEVHRQAGRAEESLALVAEAWEFIARTGERNNEADFHRLEGELRLARSPSDPAEAEACFRKALEVARRQSAKSYELRAATSLARLWQGQDRKNEARALLAPVYEWFTEGFDTRDLKDAKALLEELA